MLGTLTRVSPQSNKTAFAVVGDGRLSKLQGFRGELARSFRRFRRIVDRAPDDGVRIAARSRSETLSDRAAQSADARHEEDGAFDAFPQPPGVVPQLFRRVTGDDEMVHPDLDCFAEYSVECIVDDISTAADVVVRERE